MCSQKCNTDSFINNKQFLLSKEKLILLYISISLFIPLVAKLRSTSLQVIVTRSDGVKTIVSVMSSLRGGADDEPSSSLRLCTASTASSHWEHTERRSQAFATTQRSYQTAAYSKHCADVSSKIVPGRLLTKSICVVNMRLSP